MSRRRPGGLRRPRAASRAGSTAPASGAILAEPVELAITALAAGGDGVGRDDAGRVVFVPRTAPGDRVRAVIRERHRSFARADLAEVITPSPARVEPPCGYFVSGRCGGCQWQHVSAAAQATAKQALVAGALRRWITAGLVLAPLATPTPPLGWRRRARVRWFAGDGGAARIGWLAPRSHHVTDVDRCPQLEPGLDAAYGALRGALAAVLTGAGELHLVIGHGGAVHVVVDGPCPPEAAVALVGTAGIAGVEVRDHGEIVGRAGADAVELEPGLIGRADDFAQASAAGNDALIAIALAALAPRPGDAILELHAGGGNFTRALVAAGAQVTANDVVAAAALPAGVRFVAGSAEVAIAQLAAAGERFAAVLLDPPRTGARDAMLGLAALAPRVVYVSCDPATLVRDGDLLAAAGLVPRQAWPVDLMPQTSHVEVVVRFERDPT